MKHRAALVGFVKTPKGTPAGYQGPQRGPFRCDHCEYANKKAVECRNDDLVKEFKEHYGLDKDAKTAPIQPGGCCNYFERDPKKSGPRIEEVGKLKIARSR